MKKVKITWVKSQIGTLQSHRATLQALGLRRMNQTVEKTWNDAIAGMVAKVSYLVKVEEV